MVDMVTKLDQMPAFVEKMKAKIIARSQKHQDNGAPLHISGLTDHFIDELIEFFNLKKGVHDNEIKVLRRLFYAWASLDKEECVDLANMAWIMSMTDKDGWIRANELPDKINHVASKDEY